MKPEQAQKLNDSQFKRYFGIEKKTYTHILTILQEGYTEQHKKGGRNNDISLENKLMITLSYYREYRTQFHIGLDFGISESAVCKAIKWVESILVDHKDFALPSKKALWQDPQIDSILIDATEIPCERPKKSKNTTTQAKRNDTP